MITGILPSIVWIRIAILLRFAHELVEDLIADLLLSRLRQLNLALDLTLLLLHLLVEHVLVLALHLHFLLLLAHLMPTNHLHVATVGQHSTARAALPLQHWLLLLGGQVLVILILLVCAIVIAPLNILLIIAELV